MNYYPFGLKHKGYNNVTSASGNSTAQKRKFMGMEFQDELSLEWYDVNARNYDAALGRWFVMDPLAEDYLEWSPYNYSFNSPLKYNDPTGLGPEDIIIKGSPEFKNKTLANLQALTDHTLQIDSDGNVTISEINFSGGKNYGTELVSSLISSSSTTTIVETSGGNMTSGGTFKEAAIQKNGKPGTGVKEVEVSFNPDKETGGKDVTGSRIRPTEIGLGHELIHSKNRIDGKVDTRSSGERDPDRPKGKGKILSKEEMNTRKKENILRQENGVPLRKTKQ